MGELELPPPPPVEAIVRVRVAPAPAGVMVTLVPAIRVPYTCALLDAAKLVVSAVCSAADK